MTSTAEHTERWLPIPGYEGSYEVSDMGRVRSLDRVIHASNGTAYRKPGRLLRLVPFTNGHLYVNLCKPGVSSRTKSVHRLVLTAFVGPCPEGMECCHNNGVHSDNRLVNLRWDTRSANMNDRFRHGWIGPRATRDDPDRCVNGHEMTPENSRKTKNSNLFPRCKKCHAQEQRAYRERKRQEMLAARDAAVTTLEVAS